MQQNINNKKKTKIRRPLMRVKIFKIRRVYDQQWDGKPVKTNKRKHNYIGRQNI